MKETLSCILQNRSGALDRVLGALTYRGFMPEQMFATTDKATDRIHWLVTFESEDTASLEKLIKVLEKQIYVIEVHRLMMSPAHEFDPAAAVADAAQLASMFSRVTLNRRVANANHA